MEKRLIKELKDFTQKPPPGIRITNSTNLHQWFVEIKVENSIYSAEIFTVRISFNKNYPMESPEVIFIPPAPIHPHIYSNGHICLSILYDHWTPALTASTVCLSLQSMLSSCSKKELPKDNDDYIRTCKKNPKDSNWYFHDDTV